MYKFIKECKEGYSISEEDIERIEEEYGIEIPSVLRKFYYNYNCARIHLCKFYVEGCEYEISEILPLKYGEVCFEQVLENDRLDDIIPRNMLPLANNRGGDYYYWDTLSENVYIYFCDDIENPIYICKSIEEMFEIMNKSQS